MRNISWLQPGQFLNDITQHVGLLTSKLSKQFIPLPSLLCVISLDAWDFLCCVLMKLNS